MKCRTCLLVIGSMVVALLGLGTGRAQGEGGSIVAWGYNGYGQCDVQSPNADFVATSGGFDHTLGLKSDHTIVAWGRNDYGQCNVPSPNVDFVAVAAGSYHSLGLRSDGTIVAWGRNDWGECNVPLPNAGFVAIAAGAIHSVGLKSDGTIVAWGHNADGECNVPAPNAAFVKITACAYQTLGLKFDRRIVAWGRNDYGQCSVPSPNVDFVAVAAGAYHSLGLKSNGSIVAWGSDADGQCNVPAPNADFTAISGGHDHSLGLKADGSIVAWGQNWDGQCNVPAPNAGFVAVSAGGHHSLGLGPQVSEGACCQSDGTCVLTAEGDCLPPAVWQGVGSACVPNPCLPGACCNPTTGDCAVTLQANCSYDWHGEWTTCIPNPCPQPTGACCDPTTGGCTVTTQASCSYNWQGEWTTCTPNPCPQPPGTSVYYVRSDGSGASPPYFPTIQAAINYVNLQNGDVIELIGTPFTGVGNRAVNFNGRLVTVRSQGGDPDQCVINCQGYNRGFIFNSGEDNQAVLEAITIAYGIGEGGGIHISSSSSPWIKGCKILSCVAGEMTNGGGVYVGANASPLLTNCTIAYCSAGTLRYGAAGGGIYSDETSRLTMRNCIVYNNSSNSSAWPWTGRGGGVFCASGNLSNCEIRGNSARHGGGVASDSGGVTLESCLITGNFAQAGGGGISGTNLTITNCTIAGNDGSGGGGGVSSGGGTELVRTILWGNCALEGPDGGGAGLTFTCCDVNPANLSGSYVFNGLQVFTDPRFCASEPCGWSVAGDYHLGAGSPCLPQASPCHNLIGVLGQGCPASDVEDLIDGAALDLMPGRPNPFVDETAITFGLARSAVVDLAIYDVSGRCVRRLASRTPYAAGVHQLIWKRSDDAGRLLPSGVYICRLRAGEEIKTSRLVVLR